MSRHTVGAYRSRSAPLRRTTCAEQGITDPSQVTSAMIGELRGAAARGRSRAGRCRLGRAAAGEASAARAVVAVRSLHRFARAEGLTADDPARSIRPPKPPRRLPKALSLEQVQAMLAVPATDTELGLRDAALLELLYGTGLRISEAVALDVDDVDRLVRAAAGEPAPGCGCSAKGARNASCRSARTPGRRWMHTWSAAGRCSPHAAAALRHCS